MRKILLIEDDFVMRENTAELLELAGFKVEVAENGKLGVEKAKSFIPDLIVCDIMMPVLDGYGVLHVLTSEPTTSTIPFIFLSAKADKSEIRKGMQMGADDYLSKPFEESDLLSAIESRLKKNALLKKKLNGDIFGDYSVVDIDSEALKILSYISNNSKTVSYHKKQVIFHEQDPLDYLYFIVEGKVKTFKSNENGKEFITKINTTDSYLGVISIFENTVCSESAICLEDTRVKKIPKDLFLSEVLKNRILAAYFIKKISTSITITEQKLLNMAYNTVRKRIADVLIDLNNESVAGEYLRVTREDLASMTGTAIETGIRALRDLKKDELIEVKGRMIRILDLERLKSLQY